MKRVLFLIAAGCLAALPARAAKPPRVHALTNVRIVVAPGQVIANGTVVLRDGVIEAVGAAVQPPADARVWDLKGLTVYAGLIDPYTVRAFPEGKPGDKAGDKAADAERPNPLLVAERDVVNLPTDETATKKLRDAGFTTALVAPKDGLFRGQSALFNLGEGGAAQNLLRRGVAQNLGLKPQSGEDAGYPASLMGAVALARQTLLDAGWQAQARTAYAHNPQQPRPALGLVDDALEPALEGHQPVFIEAEDVLATLRAAALAREFKLHAVVVGNGEEYKRLEEVKRTGLPEIVPLAFPKPPTPHGDNDRSVSLDELRQWDAAPDNPKQMLSTGLEVSFTTFRLDDPKKLYENLAKSIARGLSADLALGALTVAPAKLLGLSDRAGTVERGKMANLVVVEGDLLVEKPKIREVWVDGNRYEVKESKAAEVEPAGTWELSVKTQDGKEIAVTLELTGKSEKLSGTLAAMGKSAPLDSAEVSGTKVSVSVDGAAFGFPGSIDLTFEVVGESANGGGTGGGGSFTLTGSRTKKPSLEVAP